MIKRTPPRTKQIRPAISRAKVQQFTPAPSGVGLFLQNIKKVKCRKNIFFVWRMFLSLRRLPKGGIATNILLFNIKD
jgi:hypothetical protein